VGGFAERTGPRTVAALLLAWRLYTLILSALLGGVLAATTALGAWRKRRRSGSTRAANTPAQP
jgi:uncharacterized membrane protein YbhN (UPF0104 family)